MERVRYEDGGLWLAARGTSPVDSTPLTCPVGDRSYEAEVTLDLEGAVEAGLLLFYNPKAFVGVGFDGKQVKTFEFSEDLPWMRPPLAARSVRVRLTNDDNVITYHYSTDGGRTWVLHGLRMEVSGYHHNVFGGFLSLKPAIYSVGSGRVRLSDFRYRALT